MLVSDNLQSGFWVFGYGSLMWNPGFDYAERVPARLAGYARSFCMWSIHHRGTVENPGLVLALDRVEGASCQGLAFRVEACKAQKTIAELRERELVSSAYVETQEMITLNDGRALPSVVYVIDPDHAQYTGHLSLERQAQVIAGATGGRGPNSEYLYNTAEHLAEIGMADAELTRLADLVRAKLASKSS